jgi:hypothetical protein
MKEESSGSKEGEAGVGAGPRREAEGGTGPKGDAEDGAGSKGDYADGTDSKGEVEVGSDLQRLAEVGSDLQEGMRRLANLSLPARDKPERSVRLMKERQMLQKYN